MLLFLACTASGPSTDSDAEVTPAYSAAILEPSAPTENDTVTVVCDNCGTKRHGHAREGWHVKGWVTVCVCPVSASEGREGRTPGGFPVLVIWVHVEHKSAHTAP